MICAIVNIGLYNNPIKTTYNCQHRNRKVTINNNKLQQEMQMVSLTHFELII